MTTSKPIELGRASTETKDWGPFLPDNPVELHGDIPM
jgi:hypothetical protein